MKGYSLRSLFSPVRWVLCTEVGLARLAARPLAESQSPRQTLFDFVIWRNLSGRSWGALSPSKIFLLNLQNLNTERRGLESLGVLGCTGGDRSIVSVSGNGAAPGTAPTWALFSLVFPGQCLGKEVTCPGCHSPGWRRRGPHTEPDVSWAWIRTPRFLGPSPVRR